MPKTRVIHIRYIDDYPKGRVVYIGRGSKWGNPYVIGKDGDRLTVYSKFRAYVRKHPLLQSAARKELQGKVLGCFCKPHKCHGDVWARIADGGKP